MCKKGLCSHVKYLNIVLLVCMIAKKAQSWNLITKGLLNNTIINTTRFHNLNHYKALAFQSSLITIMFGGPLSDSDN